MQKTIDEELMIKKALISTNDIDAFFINLNKSVIEGEYILHKEEFDTQIQEWETKKVKDSLDLINRSIDSAKKNEYYYCSEAIKKYKALSKIIQENINDVINNKTHNRNDTGRNRINPIDDILSELKEYLKDKENVKLNYALFLINIALAELDEYLESAKWCLNDLNKLKKYLEDDQYKEFFSDKKFTSIYTILKDECNYLIFKIKYRSEIKINFKEVQKKYNFKNEDAFFSFYKKTFNHYDKSDDINGCSIFIDESKELINNGEFENLKISEIHKINKYIKKSATLDINKKKEILTKLTGILEKKIESETDSFEKISNISCLNLLRNTELYFLLDEKKKNNYNNLLTSEMYKNSNSNTIENFIEEVNKYFKEIQIIDFRAQEHLIDFLDALFDNLVQQGEKYIIEIFDKGNLSSSEIDNYEKNIKTNIDKLKDFYKSILLKFDLNKEALTNFDLKPIYLEEESCKHAYAKNDETLNIFLDSSYILPVNFENVKIKFENKEFTYKHEIKLIKGELDVLFNLKKSTSTYKEYEKQLKANEFKVVQIVAMFVSIATFILINVKIFDNKSGIESMGILLGLAGIFIIFNGFFNWLISYQIHEKHFTNSTRVILLISIALITFSFMILYNLPKEKENILLDSHIDSVCRHREFIKDSIKTKEKTIADSIKKSLKE